MNLDSLAKLEREQLEKWLISLAQEKSTEQLDEKVDLLFEQVLKWRRKDVGKAIFYSQMILDLADYTHNLTYRAAGLRAKAQVFSVGQGDHQLALSLYNEAIAISEELHDELAIARIHVTRIYTLAQLGRYDEVFKTGEWASHVLEKNQQWRSLASLLTNLASSYGRRGQPETCLAFSNRARDAYTQLGAEGRPFLHNVEMNRSIALRTLGRFDEAIQASQTALQLIAEFDYLVEVARAKHGLARTYYIMGNYNEALQNFEEARQVYLNEGMRHESLRVSLAIHECLLSLRRFSDVLEQSQEPKELAIDMAMVLEQGQVVFNEAVARLGLGFNEKALESLTFAHKLFYQDHKDWAARSDLLRAMILMQAGEKSRAKLLASSCAEVFAEHKFLIEEMQAHLVMVKVAFLEGDIANAKQRINEVIRVGNAKDILTLSYEGYYWLAKVHIESAELDEALEMFDKAIESMERLRGRMMVEFRAGFVEDKNRVYEDAVDTCLNLSRPGLGWTYAERAKSRALLDMLTYQLDLGMQSRNDADKDLIAELTSLQAKQEQYLIRQRRRVTQLMDNDPVEQAELVALEKQITQIWHSLLIRNADYAREGELMGLNIMIEQPQLELGQALLEYFVTSSGLMVFIVTNEEITAYRLNLDMTKIRQAVGLLGTNLRSVSTGRFTPRQFTLLLRNIQGRLHHLYQDLFAPFANLLTQYSKLVIVPHSTLHYLPFHALFDGESYLTERFQISYLPSASTLHYCRRKKQAKGVLAIGNSYGGHLPSTLTEAEHIAKMWDGECLQEEAVTFERVCEAMRTCHLIHIASHGFFRPDNPLFSGIALADKPLTTLNIFDLELRASLVTLSACQTGSHVVGGGDELLGLLRAFLAAGASSVLLSQWAVEDQSTTLFMQSFYKNLREGQTKAASLQTAQKMFIDGEELRLQHPYFWAPFYLVGDYGLL